MSLEKKLATMEFVETMTSQPSKLYLLIKDFVMKNPRDSKYDHISKPEMDFDLPEVDMKPMTKARVHIGDNTCISCEG